LVEPGVSNWDLVIAGGGPVGLVTAIAARSMGLSAVVLERNPELPEKACGEGMMPGAVSTLARLGVDLEGSREFNGIVFLDAAERATATFGHGTGRALSRQQLMQRLDARARALGVEILSGHTLREFRYHDRTLYAEASAGRAGRVLCQGRLLVAADGLRSPIRKRLGYELPARYPARFALQRHYECAPWSNWVEVHWHAQAEAYVTPLGPELVGVAILSHGRPVSHAEAMLLFPELGRRLLHARGAGRVRGAGPLEQRVSSVLAPGVALVGDAAGYLDALSGEGLALGFRCAVALVERFASGELWRYPRDHARLSGAYYGMTHLMLELSRRPRLRRYTVRYLSQRPQLFSDLLGVAADLPVPASSPLGRMTRWLMRRDCLRIS
jgi:flavin-dependent dehydrogenase